MKKNILKLIEKVSRKAAIDSVGNASQYLCYEEKLDKELKDIILSKREENKSKMRG